MLAGAGCLPSAVRSDNHGLQHEVAPPAVAFSLSHVAINVGNGGLPTSVHPSGLSSFGKALPTLVEKAGEVASQKRHQTLEEAMIKSVKGTKGSRSSSKRSAPSVGQQKQGGGGKNRKRGRESLPKLSGKATPKGASGSASGAGKAGDRP